MITVQELLHEIVAENPRHGDFIAAAEKELSPAEEAELQRYLEYLVASGHSLEFVALSYNTVTFDTLREQIYFLKHKKYRYSRFDEVAPNVYFNDEYMQMYMIGLALTAFLWPQLVELRRHFLSTLPTERSGTYLEIGPGHGRYFLAAVQATSFDRFVGLDISPTSCALTTSVIEFTLGAMQENIEIRLQDFLDEEVEGAPFATIVMGEVLEHVEEPERFLTRIASLSDESTHIHITTCINAPAVDHIYLYGSVEQLEDQFTECGLTIADRLLVPHVGTTLQECVAELLPVNVAYSLKKT